MNKIKLLELIKERAVKALPGGGVFELSGGGKSDKYIDCRILNLTPDGLRCVVGCLWEELKGIHFNAIGGPAIGIDPVIGGMLFASPWPIRGFLVRKEPKGHGRGTYIVGEIEPGDRCVLIEDVVSTGASLLRAVERVQEAGGEVIQIIALVDREMGGGAIFDGLKIPYKKLISSSQVF